MTQLIDSIAQITGHRDREILEVGIVRAIAMLVRAVSTRFYKLVPVGDQMRVHLRIEIDQSLRTHAVPVPQRARLLPSLEAFPLGKLCLSRADAGLVARGFGGEAPQYVIAMTSGREPIGWLEIDCASVLDEDERRTVAGLVTVYANHLAILDYSERDQLTGLMNRKTFDETFLKVLASTQSPGRRSPQGERRGPQADAAYWLAVADIDHFKRINDRFGHLYGDEVLVLLARLMRSSFRIADRLYRFGGEEFAILLDRTHVDHVLDVFDRFRATVESHPFPQIGTVTLSLGYTRIQAGDSPAASFDRADAALYYAKQHGRNRVCAYETLSAEGELAPKLVNQDVELF